MYHTFTIFPSVFKHECSGHHHLNLGDVNPDLQLIAISELGDIFVIGNLGSTATPFRKARSNSMRND
jgi:hypothetical protein